MRQWVAAGGAPRAMMSQRGVVVGGVCVCGCVLVCLIVWLVGYLVG